MRKSLLLVAGFSMALAIYRAPTATGQSITDVSPKTSNFPVSANLQQSPSGRLLSLAVSSDGERLYAGSFSGVWRSEDGGTSWRQLTRPQPLLGTDAVAGALIGNSVYNVVVSPVDKDLVLAATSRDTRATPKTGIYRSTDGGDSWSLAHQFFCSGPTGGGPVAQIIFAPDNPNLLYAAGGCAVAVSTDGGMHWDNKAMPGGGAVWHIVAAPQQGLIRRIYAAGDSRFWYSEDGGQTWFRDMSAGLPPGFAGFPSDFCCSDGTEVLAVEPGRPERVYMAVAGLANGPSYYHPSDAGPDGNHCNTPIVYDSNSNGIYDGGEPLLVTLYPALTPSAAAPLRHVSKLKYVDSSGNNRWDPGEGVIFDRSNNGLFDPDDAVLTGAQPSNGASLKEDPRITHVDFGVDYAPRGCGEGSLWLGDYSGFVTGDPARRAAQWSQLPGPPAYFGVSTPSGGTYVRAKQIGTGSDYLVVFSDESHVHVSAGVPLSSTSWHRLDGRNASQSKMDGDLSNKLFLHVDPHAIALSTDFNMTLKPATGVPFPYNENSVLDRFVSGRMWMANDGGVYRSDNGGVNWRLGDGLSTLQPFSIFAGVALPGRSGPGLYFGVPDDDNFFTLDGGSTWKDPVSGCGDCGEWASDPAQPNRVLEFAGRDNPPGFGLYINPSGGYPDASDPSQRRAIPFPGHCSGSATPPCPSGQNYIGELNVNTSEGHRPVVLTAGNETPLGDGDYVVIRQRADNTAVLLRTTRISSITVTTDWDDPSKAVQQGPALPSNVNVAQASGGHNNPVFYVSDPDSTRGLWTLTTGICGVMPGALRWQKIVPGGPPGRPDLSATVAQRFYIDPYNPNRIYIIDVDAVKRSEDRGCTWQTDANLDAAVTENGVFSRQLQGLGPLIGQGAVIRDMIFDRAERTRFAIGNAGVFFSLDGEHWLRLLSSTALPSYAISGFFDRISNPANRALYIAMNGRSMVRISPIPLKTPPIAKCKNVTVSAGPTCTASASIDNGSFDPDGDALTLKQTPPGPYPLGNTMVTLTATDLDGMSTTCMGTVTVVDTTPPVVTSSVSTPLLWPPQHDLTNVGLAAKATDNCTPNPALAIKGIFSTEPDQGPDADSNFSPDAANVALGTLRLRSERRGDGNRVYLNVVKATDGAGNVGFSCTTVVVPLNQNPAAIAAVNAAAAAAQTFCAANNGTPPTAYLPVGVGPVIGPKQ